VKRAFLAVDFLFLFPSDKMPIPFMLVKFSCLAAIFFLFCETGPMKSLILSCLSRRFHYDPPPYIFFSDKAEMRKKVIFPWFNFFGFVSPFFVQ